MKNWKRLLALLLAGAMALSLCACGSADADPSNSVYADDASGSPDPDADPSASPEIVADLSQGVLEFSAGMSAGDTALTVNGEDVPADLFLYWLNYNCYYFLVNYSMFGLGIADYANELIDDTVSFCTNDTLLRHKAAELGCLPTDAQVQAAKESVDEETVEMLKAAYGLSDTTLNYLLLSDAYYDNVLEAVTHEPSSQELDEYLDSLGVFSVKHILLKTTDDSDQPLPDDEIAAKRTQAEDLLSQLQAASGLEAKFDELMNQYSEDPGLATSPDGYTFDSTASLVGGFREAALELEIGGLSGIVETDYGYHIMLRLPLSDETKIQYGANFRNDAMGELVLQWADAAEVTRSDALSSLNAADFFDRQMAYQQALSERDASAG